MGTATTTADVLQDARVFMQQNQRDERNKLAAPYTAGGGQLTMTYDTRGITPGATLSIGLNTFYVWAVEPTSKTVTVSGGEDGSVDADADAGDTVLVRPRVTDATLLRFANDELADLSSPASGLYAMRTFDFTVTGAQVGYDMTGVTDLQGIYSVRYVDGSGAALRDLPRLKPHEYRLERNTPGGLRFMLLAGGLPGFPVTVSYRSGFTPLSSLSQLVTSTGLPATATDLLAMGAALRAVVGREIRRNDITTQGDTRRAEEVPAGANQAAWRGLAAQRAIRLQNEASRLQAAYPVLM